MHINSRHIMFDMDGVIIDSTAIHSEAFSIAFSDYEVDFNYDNWKGSSTKHVVAGVLKNHNLAINELDRIIKIKQEVALFLLKSAHPSDLLINGAAECLALLSDRYKIALCTSAGEMAVQHLIDGSDLRSIFTFILSANDVVNSKPSPEIYLIGAQKFGVHPKDCVVIEDSKNGLISAYLAGCQVIHFEYVTDLLINSLPFYSKITTVQNHAKLQNLLLL